MNRSMIVYVLGTVLRLEGLFLLIPCICSLIYQEHEGLAFFTVAVLAMVLGYVSTRNKPEDNSFFLREGCVTTALSWIILSVIGSLPFVLTNEIPSIINAIFETASGFTTTGASILLDVESMSHTALLWRSFTHWIGGMGVLVFLLAVIPLSGGGSVNLMRAESPGPSVGKLVPKIRSTATILYQIYIALTLSMLILLIIFGMPVFDAICTAFGTAGTGGFGVRSDSLAGYSIQLQWITTVFMILFGVNFNAYFFLLLKEYKKAFSISEVKAYFLVIISAVTVITINILNTCHGVFDAITKSSFQVASIITTTGFSTVDFDKWPDLSRSILVMLMFIGACAGSTGGGTKISRILILGKVIRKELFSYNHPKGVKHIKMDDRVIDDTTIRGVFAYFCAYGLIFVVSALCLYVQGADLISGFTAVAATLNNIGPGLGEVGPSANFDAFPVFSKIILTLDMIAGRLELFPMLVLISPQTWKDS